MKINLNILIISIGLMFSMSMEAVRVTPGSVVAVSFADLNGAEKGRFAKIKAALQDSAVQEEDLRALMRSFLKESPRLVRVQDSSGTTLLSYAAAAARVGAVALLLDEGSDPQMANHDRKSPLDNALESGNEGVVNLLLETFQFGASQVQLVPKKTMSATVQQTSATSPTAVSFSDSVGEDKGRFTKIKATLQDVSLLEADVARIVDALLKESPRLVRIQDSSGTTLLSYAVGAGRVRSVTLLLKAGSDSQLANKDQKTPLDKALESGNETLVNLLLEPAVPQAVSSASTSSYAQVGASSMTSSAVSSTQSMVQKKNEPPLFAKKVRVLRFEDLDASGQRDFKAAHDAVKAKDTGTLAKVMTQNKDVPFMADKFGNTLLILAAKTDNQDSVQLLLNAGAEVNAADTHGNTALSYAVRNGDGKIAKMLLLKNADPNLPDDTWTTPLARALIKPRENAEVIDVLARTGGKLYLKVAIMLIPSEEYRYKNLKEPFEDVGKQYLSNDVRNVVALHDPTDFHISLAYLAIPVAYDKAEGNAYRRTVQEYLKSIRDMLQSKGVMTTLRELNRKDPFSWNKMAWFGDYIAVSYNGPRGYDQLVDDLYTHFFKMIPGAQKTYSVEAAPHVSVGHLRKNEVKPARSLNQPVLSGTPQKNILAADSSLLVDVRVISGTDPAGNIHYSAIIQ